MLKKELELATPRLSDGYRGVVTHNGSVVASTTKHYADAHNARIQAGKLRAKIVNESVRESMPEKAAKHNAKRKKRPYKKASESRSKLVQALHEQGVAYINAAQLINKMEKEQLSEKKTLDIVRKISTITIA